MSTVVIDPIHWTTKRLANFDHEALHELTLKVAGTHHAYQLVLGRCLLAVQRNKLYQRFGCSGAVHYGVLVLGLTTQKARTLRWVAQKLEALPLLTGATQSGEISYSKVREVVRKATPETEELWLELCRSKTYRQIEVLVGHTPEGGLPGDLPEDGKKEPALCDLRLSLGSTARIVIERGLAAYSLKEGRPVPLGEAVEALFAKLLEKDSDDHLQALVKAQKEARKDLLAQRSRQNPLVQEARHIAKTMGLGQEEAGEMDPVAEVGPPVSQMAEHLLATAACMTGESEEHPEQPAREISESLSGDLEGSEQPAREISESLSGDFEGSEQPARVADLADTGLQDPARETSWQNLRLQFNQEARQPTSAQRREILRRDGYCCSTPGCPNHLWLEVHHVVSYSEKGKTLPGNLITLCSRYKNVHEKRLIISGRAGGFHFRDSQGSDLARQYDLSVACWLDFRIGWRGREENSHQHRALAVG